MALGVMAVANRLRLEVPQTLSVAGFDDTPGAKVVWPQLTTVRQPIQAMAAAAADLLLSGATRAEGGAPPLGCWTSSWWSANPPDRWGRSPQTRPKSLRAFKSSRPVRPYFLMEVERLWS
jgi:hypothetical protein